MLALYHNDMSLCAQKVRVGLAEKGLEWESRHLVLRAGEHQQPALLLVEPVNDAQPRRPAPRQQAGHQIVQRRRQLLAPLGPL